MCPPKLHHSSTCMKINVKKTKAMCISRQGKTKVKIYIDRQLLEQLQQFRYLGSLITEDGYCDKEIRSRIGLAKVKFIERKKILTRKMKLDLRKRIVICLVWCVALYASETWTISKTVIKRIEALEMWIWRKMEKISWTAKVSNSEVLNQVKENNCIINTINQRKHRWLGHVLRHDVLLRDILEGRMTGKCKADTACWAIQRQRCEAKFEAWHRYGTQSQS